MADVSHVIGWLYAGVMTIQKKKSAGAILKPIRCMLVGRVGYRN